MLNLISCLCFWVATLLNPIAHPVHISVTNLEYFDTKQQFEVTFKLFKDDFEAIIYTKYNAKLHLDTENNNDEQYIKQYIKQHFKIECEGENSSDKLRYISKTTNHEAIWLKFEIQMRVKEKIKINNSLMTDYFHDQRNLLIFTHGDKQEGVSFNYHKHTNEFEL